MWLSLLTLFCFGHTKTLWFVDWAVVIIPGDPLSLATRQYHQQTVHQSLLGYGAFKHLLLFLSSGKVVTLIAAQTRFLVLDQRFLL